MEGCPIVAAGAVRKVDALGRVVIPMNVREALGITPGAQMEIFIQGTTVMFRPYGPFCQFCGGAKDLRIVGTKQICLSCREGLKNELKVKYGEA